jgi:hypothetical protein
VMVRHVIDRKIEVSGGVRVNRWSGAYAVQTTPGAQGRWNSMFNVHWNGVDANGVPNPGYSAKSTDWTLGSRYRINDKASAGVSMVRLGKASTANPINRGQNNTLTVGTASVGYSHNKHLQLYATASVYKYGQKGFAPLSVPSHSAFTNVDSRVASRGNSISVGTNINF